jgi:hypothetical protein
MTLGMLGDAATCDICERNAENMLHRIHGRNPAILRCGQPIRPTPFRIFAPCITERRVG